MKVLQTTGELKTDRRKSILIIDDEQGILESLDELFSEKFNVFMAMDGEEGIDFLKRHFFDLVLLDLTMPGIDGMEVLKWIRGLSEPPPVMILTGHSTHERAKGCANSGVLGYIEKPFNPAELFNRVSAFLQEDKKKGNISANLEPAIAEKLSSLVAKAIRFINIRYTDHVNPLRPNEVAAHVGVSREHLTRSSLEKMV
jgi:DNA-binding response OmpR family regulator